MEKGIYFLFRLLFHEYCFALSLEIHSLDTHKCLIVSKLGKTFEEIHFFSPTIFSETQNNMHFAIQSTQKC